MSYQLNDPQNDALNKEKEKLFRDLTICRKVEQTIKSPGWADIIAPLIDRKIVDVCGGKLNGHYYPGTISRARKDERREYHIGYKQALIELYNYIMEVYVNKIPKLEDRIKAVELAESKGYKVPMVEDTRYAV